MTPDARKRLVRAILSLVITAAVTGGLFLLPVDGAYLWLKAVHIIAVIAWMAGMLYLPRLFVYHCKAEPGSQQSETFKVMEHRLLTVIVNPAMVVVWAVGLWLIWAGPDPRYGWLASGWLQAKLVLVFVLSGVHGMLSAWVRAFAADQNRHSEKFYRIINEVPTLLMIAIVLLVVIKPF
jgi:protoporphyrinogen IX oxidase